MGAAVADPRFLGGAPLRGGLPAAAFGVEGQAPAAAPDAVMPGGQLCEVRPCGLVESFHAEAGHRRSLVLSYAFCSRFTHIASRPTRPRPPWVGSSSKPSSSSPWPAAFTAS